MKKPRRRAPPENAVLRLATLVLDSNDAIIIRDLDDRITAWNKGAQRMYGYTEAEAAGMSVRRLIPDSRRLTARGLVQVSAAPIETRRRAKGGRVLDVLLTATVLRDAKGRAVEVATTERDVTTQKRAERTLRKLRARLISAQETERKRLARELHDGVGQILSGVKFRLEALGDLSLNAAARSDILRVGRFLDRAISEIRRVSQNLMPSELEDLGLEPALRSLCREFKTGRRAEAALTTKGIPTFVPRDLSLALFRIAQEALNNAARHSKARAVSVDLSLKGGELRLSVMDDGSGFSRPGRGIGLASMRERAEAVGGTFTLESSPGEGTILRARVPLAGLGAGA